MFTFFNCNKEILLILLKKMTTTATVTERTARYDELVAITDALKGVEIKLATDQHVEYGSHNGIILSMNKKNHYKLGHPYQVLHDTSSEIELFLALTITRNDTMGILKKYPGSFIVYIPHHNDSVSLQQLPIQLPIRPPVDQSIFPNYKDKTRVLVLFDNKSDNILALFDCILGDLSGDDGKMVLKLDCNHFSNSASNIALYKKILSDNILPFLVKKREPVVFDIEYSETNATISMHSLLVVIALASSSYEMNITDILNCDEFTRIKSTENVVKFTNHVRSLFFNEEPGTIGLLPDEYKQRFDGISKSIDLSDEKSEEIKKYMQYLVEKFDLSFDGEPEKVETVKNRFPKNKMSDMPKIRTHYPKVQRKENPDMMKLFAKEGKKGDGLDAIFNKNYN